MPGAASARRIVIVGAGHAGATAAALLRQGGFDGAVVLVGAEPVGPYHRPPLSKSLLNGEFEQPLQTPEFYSRQLIELRTATEVGAIDRDATTVRLADGETIRYDTLILATGAKARRLQLPGVRLRQVHELRTLADARLLQDVLSPRRRLAVVGGGWIGLEVAASAIEAGVEVTVIEREQRLLARVASPELSEFLSARHARAGVRLQLGAQVAALEGGARGEVRAVVLMGGETIACDEVLVGVGAAAEDRLAREAGLRCEDGVVVDACGRTGDPRIYAIGDVTRRPVPLHEGLLRVESIPSAIEQARQAVASILGVTPPAPEVPWFWSDQFDLKLQIAGLLRDADQTVVRAPPDRQRLAVFHTRAGRLIAVEAVNSPAEFTAGKLLIRDQVPLNLGLLADPEAEIGQFLPTPAAVHTGAGIELPAPAASPAGRDRGAEPIAEPVVPEPVAGLPRAIFVQADGGERSTVTIAAGRSLMDAAISANVPGIIAECGGMCSCGTCHVFVAPEWLGRLPEPEYEEADLLEFLEGRQANSRLSCQIVMSDDLDGIVVSVPQLAA